jgi:2-desacetyl-2-hydroxyethyl bacteriochlorophyllide A dehydrogenase
MTVMQAARWFGPRDLRIDSISIPEPRPDEVLVRILACGVCGTDLEEYEHGAVSVVEGSGAGRAVPLTIGHEPVGVVVVAAFDGSGPAVGTVVVPDVVDGCEACWWCRAGEQGLCPQLIVRGQHHDGGLAEYMTARARSCVPVPAGRDPRLFALAEPVAVAVRALRKLDHVVGARIGVLGLGTIGALVARAALTSGARGIVAADPIPAKRALLPTGPAVRAVHPDELTATVAELGAPGLDAVIECTGRPGALQRALELVRPGGRVVMVGLPTEHDSIDGAALALTEKSVVGSAAHRYDTDITDAVALIADGRVRVDDLVTHRFPLAHLVTDALPALADSATSGAIKVLIDFPDPTELTSPE